MVVKNPMIGVSSDNVEAVHLVNSGDTIVHLFKLTAQRSSDERAITFLGGCAGNGVGEGQC